jgi:hypothetical protein
LIRLPYKGITRRAVLYVLSLAEAWRKRGRGAVLAGSKGEVEREK